jgi:hypothetical protein
VEAQKREDARKDAELKEKAFTYRWHKGGFDTVLLVDFTITNPTIYPWRDLHVQCDLIAETGRVIGTKAEVLYVIVPPQGQKTLERFNLGFVSQQVYGTVCRLLSMTWGAPAALTPVEEVTPPPAPPKAKKAGSQKRPEKGP